MATKAQTTSPVQIPLSVRTGLKYLQQRKLAVDELIRSLELYSRALGNGHIRTSKNGKH